MQKSLRNTVLDQLKKQTKLLPSVLFSQDPRTSSGSQSTQPTLFHPLIFPPKQSGLTFFENIVLLGCSDVGETQNRIEKAKRDAGNEFFGFG